MAESNGEQGNFFKELLEHARVAWRKDPKPVLTEEQIAAGAKILESQGKYSVVYPAEPPHDNQGLVSVKKD